MSTADVTALLPALLTDAGLPAAPIRQPLRVWAHSGVERLRLRPEQGWRRSGRLVQFGGSAARVRALVGA